MRIRKGQILVPIVRAHCVLAVANVKADGVIEAAVDELPEEQREVFIAHEIEGRSFKELAESTGLSINTLLSRKHYAVLNLRRRLRSVYDEFGNM